MATLRKQMQDAVIARLGDEFGPGRAFSSFRLVRDVQTHNLPMIVVAVSDTESRTDNEAYGETVIQHDLTIDVRVCVSADEDDVAAVLDTLTVRAKKSLVDPGALGVGGTMNWACAGSAPGQPLPIEDGLLIAEHTTFTTSMFALDGDPETNLHP